MVASEGGEGNGRRRGVIELVGANGVVRHEGMARRSILLGKADPAAAVSCTRMCGPSRRDMASTLRVTFICGNGFCMLFASGTCSRRLFTVMEVRAREPTSLDEPHLTLVLTCTPNLRFKDTGGSRDTRPVKRHRGAGTHTHGMLSCTTMLSFGSFKS